MPDELIDASIHCPLCGSGEYRRHPEGRICAACGHRDFNNPITAVAVFLLDAEGRVLLIRRAKDPAAGTLAPPGGFVDAGETLEEAARREVWEEVGLEVRELAYLCSHPNRYVYRNLGRPVCDVFFRARVEGVGIVLQAEEASAWEWRPVDGIDPGELAFDSMRAALGALRGQPGR